MISCTDSKDTDVGLPSVSQAFVICEGNYGSNNASLSILDTVETDTTFGNVFSTVNGRKLGDHAHSMLVVDSLGFIAVTGSDRVEIINTRTYESIESISLIKSPRNMVRYNDKLLVASYEDSLIVGLSYATRSQDFSVKLTHRPDEIAVINNKAYVSNAPNMNDSVISVIDLTTHTADTIMLTKNPVSLVADPQRGKVYVACAGGASNGYVASIDAVTDRIVEKIGEFNSIKPVKLELQDSLLAYIASSNGPIHIYNLSQSTMLSSISGNYFALAFGNGELFATDGLDFISNGDLVWFSKNFQVRHRFKVGRAPAGILFK